MTWRYDDPRWDHEVVSGVTYRDLQKEYSGLKKFENNLVISEITPSELKQLRQVSVARNSHFNVAPKNFHPVSEMEIVKSGLLNGSPLYSEYRQLYPFDSNFKRKDKWPWEEDGYIGFIPPSRKYFGNGGMISINLFYKEDGTGWGMSPSQWDERIYWYRFGCIHEWGNPPDDSPISKIKLAKCQHLYFCTKCTYHTIIDSSD